MSVSKNAAYNVLGALVPSILTLVTIPLYLQTIGVERYGFLTLCWVILGYSGFLDVSLALAVARNLAASRNKEDSHAGKIVWTSIWLSLGTGLIGAIMIYIGAILYFNSMGDMDAVLKQEVGQAVPLLAIMAPIMMLGGVFSGVLQGHERFFALNAIGATTQTLVAILPLVAAYLWNPALNILICGAFAGRIIALLWLFWVGKAAISLWPPQRPSRELLKSLSSFGGWISLTVIANALINSVDRLAIGIKIGAAAVPSYAIPYGLVSRVILIPHALSTALFPRFAYAEKEEQQRFLSSSIQAVLVIVTPAIICIIAGSEPFFRLWIGPELATTAAPIAYVLAAGFWLYCIGHIAYTTLQAIGRPDLVSKILLAEVIPYCLMLFAGLWTFGLIGAAGAFTLRALVDCLLFLRAAKVPLSTLGGLVLPAALIFGSVAAAAAIAGPARYLVLGVLFTASAAWSASNIPEVLRPYLAKFTTKLPLGRR